MHEETKGSLYVIAAACGWGCTGFFVNSLALLGLSPVQIVTMRVLCCAAFFFAVLLVSRPQALAFALRDIGYFIGSGVIGLSLFTWCNFTAITLSSMSVGAVLLYTAPIFVLAMASIFFKEKMTPAKIVAVVCTFLGCALVSGVFENGDAIVPPVAVLFGLASGFFYALYSVFSRLALVRNKPATVTFYTFLFSGLSLVPFARLDKALTIINENNAWPLCLTFVLLSTALPYLLYTKGLNHIETGKASVLATLDPLVAVVIGVTVFQDALSPIKSTGIALILSAVLLLSLRAKSRARAVKPAPSAE